MWDICIIGGGASAMAAAITAASENPGLSICVLEKKDALGKKLAATGNGKCNLTNAGCPNVRQTLEFFSSMGIVTRTDEQGRIYPYSQQARDVVYGMIRQMKALGIRTRTGCTAERISRVPGGFQIAFGGGEELSAKRVLLAAGGKAAPQFGTSGDGYTLAKQMGHTITRLSPVLTALDVKEDFRLLKGIRMKASVGLWKDETLISQEEGEVQFTAEGLSGICVFDLSRFVKFEPGEAFSEGIGRYGIRLDFLPHMDLRQVEAFLDERCGIPGLKAKELLLSILPSILAERLLSAAQINGDVQAAQVTEEKLRILAGLLKGWKLTLSGVKGWKTAQCTSGGVELSEIDERTMESRLAPGFYFAGEIIDYDGPCGGFNLQNAWETGIKAGKAMAASL
ncbi:aminoacetone oxidase family FAD-binding enzyme [Anaerovorax odorimutans]|uniref:Aminoacetone oxidase family FAD-binding enzyme n=1 Tax=Anaerovorax odorimutans TaxID=109327 RepID=A0ABT1RMD3_9FIRM|nr:aminoacetone oxidase family FAD-binding enzyme [Anaerovorax odorimutans]MCQ4636351.1 aminoacetone oxidase family FAD-binding enzyme [Anaerovorax odorimutans]